MERFDNALLACPSEHKIQLYGKPVTPITISDTTIANEMKIYSIIMPIKAEHDNLEITGFLKVATSFTCKVGKELNENNGNELAATRKRKQEHCQRSADSLTQNT
ncbi:hypothetical protein ACTXT7_003222 [Hymenolepis weldensis]